MRLLVLTNMYPPHHYGGYELLCQEFVAASRARGHEVVVLTSDIVVAGAPVAGDDPAVRRQLRLYWEDHLVTDPSRREAHRIERHNQGALARALDEVAPDVVSVWAMGAMSLGLLTTCRRRGRPIVSVVCDDWLVYGPIVDRWARFWRRSGPVAAVGDRLLDVPCRLPDLGSIGTHVFISEYTRRAAEAYGGWALPDATVGYCGINTDDFAIGAARPRPGWDGRLLHVGRIDERKGIDLLLRALARLAPPTRLDVVGRGDDRYLAELRSLARSLGVEDRVEFSVAERGALAAVYADADALLFAPRWAEPFGLVPIEAMACATPVVGTGTGGSDEFLVDERNCLRVPVDDVEALVAAVQRLAGDPDLRSRLVAGGLATAAELSLPRWLALLTAWHEAAATGFADGRPPERTPIGVELARLLD